MAASSSSVVQSITSFTRSATSFFQTSGGHRINKKLCAAIKSGDYRKVRKIIEKDSSIINSYIREFSYYIYFSFSDELQGKRVIVQQTPLQFAMSNRQLPIVKLLLQQPRLDIDKREGFIIDKKSSKAEDEYFINDSVKIIIEKDKYSTDEDVEIIAEGGTALHLAYQHYDLVMIHLLITHGANVEATNYPNMKPAQLMRDTIYPIIVKLAQAITAHKECKRKNKETHEIRRMIAAQLENLYLFISEKRGGFALEKDSLRKYLLLIEDQVPYQIGDFILVRQDNEGSIFDVLLEHALYMQEKTSNEGKYSISLITDNLFILQLHYKKDKFSKEIRDEIAKQMKILYFLVINSKDYKSIPDSLEKYRIVVPYQVGEAVLEEDAEGPMVDVLLAYEEYIHRRTIKGNSTPVLNVISHNSEQNHDEVLKFLQKLMRSREKNNVVHAVVKLKCVTKIYEQCKERNQDTQEVKNEIAEQLEIIFSYIANNESSEKLNMSLEEYFIFAENFIPYQVGQIVLHDNVEGTVFDVLGAYALYLKQNDAEGHRRVVKFWAEIEEKKNFALEHMQKSGIYNHEVNSVLPVCMDSDIHEKLAVAISKQNYLQAKKLLENSPEIINDYIQENIKTFSESYIEEHGVIIHTVKASVLRTPLQMAASTGYLPIVKVLLQQPNIEINKKEGFVLHGNLMLHDKCAEHGGSALHLVYESGDLAMIHLLTSHGADVEATNNYGVKPAQLRQDKIYHVISQLAQAITAYKQAKHEKQDTEEIRDQIAQLLKSLYSAIENIYEPNYSIGLATLLGRYFYVFDDLVPYKVGDTVIKVNEEGTALDVLRAYAHYLQSKEVLSIDDELLGSEQKVFVDFFQKIHEKREQEETGHEDQQNFSLAFAPRLSLI